MTNSPPVFLDTSALIALLNRRDQHHQDIQNYLKTLREPFSGISSNLVLSEFLTFFARHGGLKDALSFHDHLINSSQFKIVWVEIALHLQAEEILKKFSDHHLSFTDATSFAIMQSEQLQYALSFDNDFTKAGFQKIP